MTAKYQISENGSVVNTIVATEEFVQSAYPSETYEVTLIVTEAEVRADRDSILVTVVDPLVSNPLRWADLTADKQAEWSQYRTDLLDVPQQDGFPHNVVWPTQPEVEL